MKRLALLCGALLLFSGIASAQDSPKTEAFGGYSYVRANEFNTRAELQRRQRLAGLQPDPDVRCRRRFRRLSLEPERMSTPLSCHISSGPKSHCDTVRSRRSPRLLFGGAHVSGSVFNGGCDARIHSEGGPCTVSGSENAFAMTLGGGVDWNATSHIGIRVIQAEYLMTRFSGFGNNGSDLQNNARISTGVVFRF